MVCSVITVVTRTSLFQRSKPPPERDNGMSVAELTQYNFEQGFNDDVVGFDVAGSPTRHLSTHPGLAGARSQLITLVPVTGKRQKFEIKPINSNEDAVFPSASRFISKARGTKPSFRRCGKIRFIMDMPIDIFQEVLLRS